MDKELPKSELPKPFRKLNLCVSESHLSGSASYRGSIVWQRILSVDNIAAHVVDKRSEYRRETLITIFSLLKREIYDAIEEDYNVDFGSGWMEPTVNGPFEGLHEKLSPNRHTFASRLRPVSELKRRMANLYVVNETYQLDYSSQPRPAYASLRIQSHTSGGGESYNQLPAGEHHLISIYDDRLKLTGNDPRISLCPHRPDGSEEHLYLPFEVFTNTGKRLCLTPGFALTDGERVAEVVAQHTPNSYPYKQPRYGTPTFLVR